PSTRRGPATRKGDAANERRSAAKSRARRSTRKSGAIENESAAERASGNRAPPGSGHDERTAAEAADRGGASSRRQCARFGPCLCCRLEERLERDRRVRVERQRQERSGDGPRGEYASGGLHSLGVGPRARRALRGHDLQRERLGPAVARTAAYSRSSAASSASRRASRAGLAAVSAASGVGAADAPWDRSRQRRRSSSAPTPAMPMLIARSTPVLPSRLPRGTAITRSP